MTNQITDIVARVSKELDIETAALMAVIEVESGGKHFATVKGKKEPLIRFEGHYFDRRLTGATKARARLRGVASPLTGAVKNPNDQEGRWLMLEKAMKLDREAALESTSWGIGQVMGGHWAWLGYSSVDQLVDTARSGLEGQIELMVRFIEKSGLVPALKAKNWSAFARVYNGPGYAKHGYHTKLAHKYAKLSIVQKWIEPAKTPASVPEILRQGDHGDRVKALQRQLIELGYDVNADGKFEQSTQEALKQFQQDCSIAQDGVAGIQTSKALAKELSKFSLSRWFMKLIKSIFGLNLNRFN